MNLKKYLKNIKKNSAKEQQINDTEQHPKLNKAEHKKNINLKSDEEQKLVLMILLMNVI